MVFSGPEGQSKGQAHEARSFAKFAFGVPVHIRPQDSEGNIRGRTKQQFKVYFRKRTQGNFSDELLEKMLYQLRLYAAVVPQFESKPITCFAELRSAILLLPGKHGWNDGDEFNHLMEAQ